MLERSGERKREGRRKERSRRCGEGWRISRLHTREDVQVCILFPLLFNVSISPIYKYM